MNQPLSSTQLKALSRSQLLGKYSTAISAQLSASIILFTASMLFSIWTDQSTLVGLILSLLISFLRDILSGVFSLGLTRFYLNLVCRRPYQIADVFYGFHAHTDKAILVRFLVSVMELLCMLPALFAILLYRKSASGALFFLVCTLLVLGACAVVFISLTYSQMYYVMLDFPGYSAKEVLTMSKRIMKGQKGRLFYLLVTLLPYYLLGLLSCGIGLLWVLPYQQTLFTNFYLDVMHREYSI